MMETTISLPAIFGKNSKCRIIKDNGISITLYDDYMVTRTQYTFEEPKIEDDELSGYKTSLVNEKAFVKKSMIFRIGVGYSSSTETYYIGFTGIGNDADSWINVESAEKGNEVLNILKEWWLK